VFGNWQKRLYRTVKENTEGRNAMLALKYFVMILGAVVFGSAASLVGYDIYLSAQLRRLLRRSTTDDSGEPHRVCIWRPMKFTRRAVSISVR
jgi:hypothetical protein